MESRHASAGFALVETLVAAAIVAIMLVVALQAIVAQSRASRLVEQRRLAVLVAQSQLAAIDAVAGDRALATQGVTSGIRWRISVRPFATRYSRPRLDEVTIAAGAGNGANPLVILRTLRIAR